jgi:hypothetical protein
MKPVSYRVVLADYVLLSDFEDGIIDFLRNVNEYVREYMASFLRRL